MTLYPSRPHRRSATIAGDVAIVLLLVLFAWLGVKVHDGVAELASLGRGLQNAGQAVGGTAHDAAGAVRDGFGSAADAVDGTPLIGDDVAGALRSAGESATAPVVSAGDDSARRLIEAGRDGEDKAYAAANLLGWVTFAVPALLLLTRWLPGRIRQARGLTAAHRIVGRFPLDPDRERELARRAAYSLPYAALAAHTRDPIGDLLAGRHDALLAALFEDADVRARAAPA